jgi:hypothetical protein
VTDFPGVIHDSNKVFLGAPGSIKLATSDIFAIQGAHKLKLNDKPWNQLFKPYLLYIIIVLD